MEESRKVYGWLVRDKNAAVGCSSMWADILRGECYCGNLLWQSSLTLLFPMYGRDGKTSVDIPDGAVLSISNKAISVSSAYHVPVGASIIKQNNNEVYSQ